MLIQEITRLLEHLAPPQLQESYDNTGLLTGNSEAHCTGILVSLDVTEAVVEEAVQKGCNLVVAHHPVIFGGLKKLTGGNYVERTVINALRNDIAIYAIHTNLDNVLHGVNGKMADRLGLINRQILAPKSGLLKKLAVFVPNDHAEKVRNAIFEAGAGHIGNYSECSFNTAGEGTFRAEEGADPFLGKIGERHTETEIKMEFIFPNWLESRILAAMNTVHPYETVAHDIYPLTNALQTTGSGIIGELPQAIPEAEMLHQLKKQFQLEHIRHTPLLGKPVKKIALCGGSGSFLTKQAVGAGADWYITADVKYYEFFDADQRIVLADIGHYESAQFTISLLFDILKEKYPTFAVLKTEINTNPVRYFH